MDHQGQFGRAALGLGIPDDEISRFTEHLRLSIRLSGGAGGAPVGQFGGLPRLPVGMDWPTVEARALPFIFSVDCAALPTVDGFGLPADGSLLFFLNHEEDHLAAGDGERRYARVVYVPPDVDAQVAEKPAGFEHVGEQYDVCATLGAGLPPWIATDDDEDEDDLSPFQQQLARDLQRDVPHLDELCALAYDLWPPDEGLASADIGGYADDEVIRSIAEQTLAGREKAGEIVIPVAQWYSKLEREQHRLTSEWVSLARFSLTDEYYHGSFVIRHDDLTAGRLDTALSVTEFSE
ncbi:hypothetical protein DDE19_16000 [Micromonospora ureilytica]|uniref:DUF1963 domain-containing protein n=1 Tax=Micromonospora ureilytica TaxID=709868 RepID=A0A3N9YA83_9ACTN|nr:DUF1963 domain-containing protein [Micromonospora ureilytica]RQX16297.1 hypothetical protein DDE19_16000 [Micromonospora ureilytica]